MLDLRTGIAFIGLIYSTIILTLCALCPFTTHISHWDKIIPVGIMSIIVWYFSMKYLIKEYTSDDEG